MFFLSQNSKPQHDVVVGAMLVYISSCGFFLMQKFKKGTSAI